jgi:KUP system potassium uptake protein
VSGATLRWRAKVRGSAAAPRRAAAPAARVALALGALGVVYGDIGTSPLYALQSVFSISGGVVHPAEAEVLGVISLVFWTIALVVSIKYVTFVMRASNDGEGGVLALTALLQSERVRAGTLVVLGVFGAALFYGDGMITPAISVLSAVQGVEVVTPGLAHAVVPLTVGILAALFAIQRWGTHRIGGMFGPVMAVWFAAIGGAGLRVVLVHPGILRGLLPTYAAGFMVHHPGVAFVALGAVVLVITGAEALYADMGHFGRGGIARSWFWIVFPALTLNYLGQGALILERPGAVANPFFLLVPGWARLPMVILAALATVIASQAVISGVFSVTRQATRLGLLPSLRIRHTSEHSAGQIYVPAVNWVLLAAVVVVVIAFRSAERLAWAYGVAVTGTFLITTTLFLVHARTAWRWPAWKLALAGAAFGGAEALFFTSNLLKIVHGGWLPLAVAAVVSTVLLTWRRGASLLRAARLREQEPLGSFVEAVRSGELPLVRVPGTAVFLSPSIESTPLALRANTERNGVLHESVVILTVIAVDVPHVPPAQRARVHDLGFSKDGIAHVIAAFGFLDEPDLPGALREAGDCGLPRRLDLGHESYFVSHATPVLGDTPGMARWRKRLFIALARSARGPAEAFGLPLERTLTIGSTVAI